MEPGSHPPKASREVTQFHNVWLEMEAGSVRPVYLKPEGKLHSPAGFLFSSLEREGLWILTFDLSWLCLSSVEKQDKLRAPA